MLRRLQNLWRDMDRQPLRFRPNLPAIIAIIYCGAFWFALFYYFRHPAH